MSTVALLAAGLVSCHTTSQGSETVASLSPSGTEATVTNASATLEMAPVEHTLKPKLLGPVMHQYFSKGSIVSNPRDDNFSRYVKFTPSCSYVAYDLNYLSAQQSNTLNQALLEGALQDMVASLTMSEIFTAGSANAFMAMAKDVSEPHLFPVHIGDTERPYGLHPASGLRPGVSQDTHGTFRGLHYEHQLHIDMENKTVQLGEGSVFPFEGTEDDFMVTSADGSTLYLDMTQVTQGYVGDLNVGVMGRVRRFFAGDRIGQ